MKYSNSLVTLVIVTVVLFSVGWACGGGDSSSTSNSNSSSSNSSSTSNSASNSSKTSPSKNIAGTYDASGTNPGGKGAYKAALTVTPHDDVYQFTWVSGKNTYDGVGVMTDNEVAVSFTDGGSGKGCGVVLYKIASDGSMDGKIGYWGTNTMENERAVRKTGSDSDLDGVYDITGKNPEGKDYSGKLIVIKSGEGYTFDWDTGTSLSGFGIRADQYVAVGFGGKQCSYVGYDVKSDGTMEGKWGSFGATQFGTEVAKKK